MFFCLQIYVWNKRLYTLLLWFLRDWSGSDLVYDVYCKYFIGFIFRCCVSYLFCWIKFSLIIINRHKRVCIYLYLLQHCNNVNSSYDYKYISGQLHDSFFWLFIPIHFCIHQFQIAFKTGYSAFIRTFPLNLDSFLTTYPFIRCIVGAS